MKIIALILIFIFTPVSLLADDRIKILRDDELENILQELSTPIFKQAGIKDNEINFVILDNPQDNAFVIGGKMIFINSGLLIDNINSPETIVGIIAHELGHLLAKHNIKRQIQMEETSKNVMYGSILGLAALTAGIPELGMFLGMGSYNAGFLTMMKYSRQHESEADKISSNLLTKAGIGTNGLLKFLNLMRENESQIAFNPYFLTHPLSKERVSFLRNYITNTDSFYSPDFVARYKRVIYKLKAFITDRLHPYSEQAISNITNRQYANSIIYYRQGKIEQSLSILSQLIEQEPNNPYFYELKGQVEMSGGKLQDAVVNYSKSFELNRNNTLIAIEYAFANIQLVGSGKAISERGQYLNKAIEILSRNINKDDDDVISLGLLANAYYLDGKKGESKLYQAERYYIMGDFKKSKMELEQAIKLLKPGNPASLRANDLMYSLDNKLSKN